MIPIFTFKRKDIDLVINMLNKSIYYLEKEFKKGNPNIKQNFIDNHKRTRNRLKSALNIHIKSTEKHAKEKKSKNAAIAQ